MTRFLEENETIILFAQGLVFFSLGFAVWLQRRRSTRLRLTRSLIWLAAFAVAEALAVWGHVFVPIQEGYVSPAVTDVLLVIRGCLKVLACYLLFQFGVRLLADQRSTKLAWRGLSSAAAAAIIVGMAFAAFWTGWTTEQWEMSVESLARIVILIPAALLSAAGLWRQRAELADVGLHGIRPFAGAAAVVLGLYAVVGAPWGNGWFWDPPYLVTDAARLDAFAIQLAVVRALLGLALCILAVKLLEIFNVEAEEQLASVDHARILAEERERFGRDLHDGTIQSLYAAGLQLESVALSADGEARDGIRTVIGGLNDTISGIRDYISDLRIPEGGVPVLVAGLREIARRHEEGAGVTVSFRSTGADRCGALPEQVTQHLEQVLREALSNATRHGRAREIAVSLTFAPDELDLVVEDDGIGIPDEPAHRGEGLRNMMERARRLGGRAVIERNETRGTRVSLEIPLDDEAPEESEHQHEEVLG